MTTDFGMLCTYRPKQHGDYAPAKRGQATVDDGDGHAWRYNVKRGELRAFRRWLSEHFANQGEDIVGGSYPHYYIEQRKP